MSKNLNTSQEKPEIDYESNKYNDSYEDLF